MVNTKNSVTDEQRTLSVQRLPLGDTGDGKTGVLPDEKGISNRPGDQPGISAQADEDADPDEEEDDETDIDDEDLEGDEDDEGDEDEDVDEQADPGSEPGKPV